MEKNLTHIALFAALIAVLGLVPKIDLATGVPITAQSLGIMLCGTVLGARNGALAVLASPAVGYIIGFPIAAFVTGSITTEWKVEVGVAATVGAILGGILLLNAIGVVGMSFMLEKTLPEAALLAAPYLIGDTIKAVLAGLVTQAIARARPAALLSRA